MQQSPGGHLTTLPNTLHSNGNRCLRYQKRSSRDQAHKAPRSLQPRPQRHHSRSQTRIPSPTHLQHLLRGHIAARDHLIRLSRTTPNTHKGHHHHLYNPRPHSQATTLVRQIPTPRGTSLYHLSAPPFPHNRILSLHASPSRPDTSRPRALESAQITTYHADTTIPITVTPPIPLDTNQSTPRAHALSHTTMVKAHQIATSPGASSVI
jgi:hypothetical protein